MKTNMPTGKGFFVIFLSVLLLNASMAIGADKIYVNGIDLHFFPFTYIDRNGNPSGFDVEALNWIAKEMGFKVQHRPKEWSTIEAALQARKIDLIASGLIASKERARQMAFTVPYLTTKQVTLTRSVSHLDIDDIILSQKLGSLSGASKVQWLKDHGSRDGWDYRIFLDNSAPRILSNQFSNRVGPAEGQPAKITGISIIREEHFVYGVNKEDAELLTILNEGLRKIMVSPFWPELIRKYTSGTSAVDGLD
jgi:polar amino acid transport system substrate-binding protein